MTAPAVAAIDIGSNAARLLVRRGADTLVHRSEITRLVDGLNATGRLQEEALARAGAALGTFRVLLDEHDVGTVRVVATAGARAAANRDELLTLAEGILGQRPRLLTPEEEARLTFAGVVTSPPAGLGEPPEHNERRQQLVVDIGGGSTELVVGRDEPEAMTSIELGSATLTDAELASDPPRPEELSNAIAIVQEHVDDALRSLPELDDGLRLVGVGGTVTTVAAVELGLAVPAAADDPDGRRDVVDVRLHGFWLTRAAAEDVFRTLAGESVHDRAFNPGLPRQRAAVIVGGCCILVGLLRRLKAPGLVVSVADLLDALVSERG